jgi:hypothetical protein
LPLSTLGELLAGVDPVPVVPVLVVLEVVVQLLQVPLVHDEHELRWNTLRNTPPVEQLEQLELV